MSPPRSADELGPAIDGDRRRWRPAGAPAGELCLYAAERSHGRPLLLVHDLRVTSSACEVRPLFECFRWRRPTYAIDLPGFGLSEREERAYSPALYAAVLAELARALRRGAAIDIVALGRGAAIAAAAATGGPGLCRSLVLIEPAGLLPPRGATLEALAGWLAVALGPGAEPALYALVTTPRLVRGALAARFVERPDEGLVAYAQRTARARGAHRAPMQVMRTHPREGDVASAYRALTVPTLVVHDASGEDSAELERFLRGRPNRFAIRVSPTCGMPHFERRSETVSALERFWDAVPFTSWGQAAR